MYIHRIDTRHSEFCFPALWICRNNIIDLYQIIRPEEIFNSRRTATIAKSSTISHNDDFITQVKIIDRMGNHNDCLLLFLGKLGKRPHQMFFCSRIKSGCWLVQEEKSRVCQKFYCNTRTFFLSSGQTSNISILVFRQFHHPKHFFNPFIDFCIACILRHLHLRCIVKHLLQRDILINDILLWHKSYDIFECLEILPQICSIAIYLSGDLRIKSTHCRHKRCLSGTGSTDNCDKFIRLYTQTDLIKYRLFTTLCRNIFVQIMNFQCNTFRIHLIIQNIPIVNKCGIQYCKDVFIRQTIRLYNPAAIHKYTIC